MWHTIESTISVFFAFLVGFVVAVMGANLVYLARNDPEVKWLLPVWLLVLGGEGGFLYWLKSDLEGDRLRPFIPEFALRQVRWPIPLRPLVGAWWLAHFAVAAAVLFLVEHLVSAAPELTRRDVPGLVFLALAAWILTHCSLLYLMLAVTAVWRSQRLIKRLWRYRLLIDLFVAASAVIVSRASV